MRQAPKVEAILCSDLHMSHTPPLARSGEKDWYDCMAQSLYWLDKIARKYNVPILCAGDIFHHWKSPPELINFLMDHLPEMWCIPGQHDLPLHNINHIHKSAYHTLTISGNIKEIPYNGLYVGSLKVFGFPWGTPISAKGLADGKPDAINVAVVHSYIWSPVNGTGYTGAPMEKRVGSYKSLKGFDAAVFGDNHKGFLTKAHGCNILNAGTFMRRISDEYDYRPAVGLLKSDATIERVFFDTKKDVFEKTESKEEIVDVCSDRQMQKFIEELDELGPDGIDFVDAVRRWVKDKKVSKEVAKILLEIVESVHD